MQVGKECPVVIAVTATEHEFVNRTGKAAYFKVCDITSARPGDLFRLRFNLAVVHVEIGLLYRMASKGDIHPLARLDI